MALLIFDPPGLLFAYILLADGVTLVLISANIREKVW